MDEGTDSLREEKIERGKDLVREEDRNGWMGSEGVRESNIRKQERVTHNQKVQ